METRTVAITGVSGYTGKYVARRLIAGGARVVNLSGHPDKPTEFGDAVRSAKLDFDNPGSLAESMRGADALVNTYWIRFAKGEMTFDKATSNTRVLIEAAVSAGLRRIVHISIANPDQGKSPYYRGKALIERLIRESGLSYAILRPTVIFGPEGILINNIAWFLRHTPVFGVPGSGDYKMRPIFVGDLADVAVANLEGEENAVVDAVGPETLTFNELLALLKLELGSRTLIMHLPPPLALLATSVIGAVLRDVILTSDEVDGLLAGLLSTDSPASGSTPLSQWVHENASRLGRDYFSELARHY